MTTPSIPNLIAALEEHDGAMSGKHRFDGDEWRATPGWNNAGSPSAYLIPPEGAGSQSGFEMLEADAYGFRWFGTHRGALAEALRTVARERDEARNLYAESHRAAEQLLFMTAKRDEAKREAESLRALLGEAAELVRIEVETNGTGGDLLARIDLARGKDGAR